MDRRRSRRKRGITDVYDEGNHESVEEPQRSRRRLNRDVARHSTLDSRSRTNTKPLPKAKSTSKSKASSSKSRNVSKPSATVSPNNPKNSFKSAELASLLDSTDDDDDAPAPSAPSAPSGASLMSANDRKRRQTSIYSSTNNNYPSDSKDVEDEPLASSEAKGKADHSDDNVTDDDIEDSSRRSRANSSSRGPNRTNRGNKLNSSSRSRNSRDVGSGRKRVTLPHRTPSSSKKRKLGSKVSNRSKNNLGDGDECKDGSPKSSQALQTTHDPKAAANKVNNNQNKQSKQNKLSRRHTHNPQSTQNAQNTGKKDDAFGSMRAPQLETLLASSPSASVPSSPGSNGSDTGSNSASNSREGSADSRGDSKSKSVASPVAPRAGSRAQLKNENEAKQVRSAQKAPRPRDGVDAGKLNRRHSLLSQSMLMSNDARDARDGRNRRDTINNDGNDVNMFDASRRGTPGSRSRGDSRGRVRQSSRHRRHPEETRIKQEPGQGHTRDVRDVRGRQEPPQQQQQQQRDRSMRRRSDIGASGMNYDQSGGARGGNERNVGSLANVRNERMGVVGGSGGLRMRNDGRAKVRSRKSENWAGWRREDEGVPSDESGSETDSEDNRNNRNSRYNRNNAGFGGDAARQRSRGSRRSVDRSENQSTGPGRNLLAPFGPNGGNNNNGFGRRNQTRRTPHPIHSLTAHPADTTRSQGLFGASPTHRGVSGMSGMSGMSGLSGMSGMSGMAGKSITSPSLLQDPRTFQKSPRRVGKDANDFNGGRTGFERGGAADGKGTPSPKKGIFCSPQQIAEISNAREREDNSGAARKEYDGVNECVEIPQFLTRVVCFLYGNSRCGMVGNLAAWLIVIVWNVWQFLKHFKVWMIVGTCLVVAVALLSDAVDKKDILAMFPFLWQFYGNYCDYPTTDWDGHPRDYRDDCEPCPLDATCRNGTAKCVVGKVLSGGMCIEDKRKMFELGTKIPELSKDILGQRAGAFECQEYGVVPNDDQMAKIAVGGDKKIKSAEGKPISSPEMKREDLRRKLAKELGMDADNEAFLKAFEDHVRQVVLDTNDYEATLKRADHQKHRVTLSREEALEQLGEAEVVNVASGMDGGDGGEWSGMDNNNNNDEDSDAFVEVPEIIYDSKTGTLKATAGIRSVKCVVQEWFYEHIAALFMFVTVLLVATNFYYKRKKRAENLRVANQVKDDIILFLRQRKFKNPPFVSIEQAKVHSVPITFDERVWQLVKQLVTEDPNVQVSTRVVDGVQRNCWKLSETASFND